MPKIVESIGMMPTEVDGENAIGNWKGYNTRIHISWGDWYSVQKIKVFISPPVSREVEDDLSETFIGQIEGRPYREIVNDRRLEELQMVSSH